MKHCIWATRSISVASALALASALTMVGVSAFPSPASALTVGTDKTLSPNESVTGTISNENQVYVYRVTAPAGGSVRFEVEPLDGRVDYEVWSDSIEYCCSEVPIVTSSGTVTTSPISVQGGTTVELRISVDLMFGAEYRVKAIVNTESTFESEPNNDSDSANTVGLNTPVGGVQNLGVEINESQYLDQDWFTHTAEKDGIYTVSARVSEGESVNVRVSDNEGKAESPVNVALGTGWRPCGKIALMRGQSLRAAVLPDDEWISAHGYYSRSGFGNVYQIKIGYSSFQAPASTSLKSAKGGPRSLTAKWKGVRGTSGYQLRYATSSSMKGAKYKAISGSKTKATVKRLRSGRRYYVQVRSYTKYPGKTMYSTWSNKRSVVTR